MAKNSQIEWTHHTFNPWWGCIKVSPACDNCYAELWAKRMGQKIWGKDAPRRFFSDAHWRGPLTWNAEAKAEGRQKRVFCASMADIFEERKELKEHRDRLWEIIKDTPNLDWLLLTKRPQNIGRMVPWDADWPRNVWLGTTVENQEFADKRIPFLIEHPARVRFLSCEPLLGPLDLSKWKDSKNKIDWVIAGGESGHHSRPMHPAWVSSLLTQCKALKIAFHFKQWGHWVPSKNHSGKPGAKVNLHDDANKVVEMTAVGKKAAGRMLAGMTWDQLPGEQPPGDAKRKPQLLRRS